MKLKHEVATSTAVVPRNIKGGKIHQCKICQKSFPYWNTYLNHTKMHQGMYYVCLITGCHITVIAVDIFTCSCITNLLPKTQMIHTIDHIHLLQGLRT